MEGERLEIPDVVEEEDMKNGLILIDGKVK